MTQKIKLWKIMKLKRRGKERYWITNVDLGKSGPGSDRKFTFGQENFKRREFSGHLGGSIS